MVSKVNKIKINKKFWSTTFTLSGTIIGAGILGLPYIFSKSGFLIGLFWLIFLGFIIIFINLCLGEIGLRTKGKHHLLGYAKKYLGKFGEKTMFFLIFFGIYSGLIAYLIGEGQSLSKLFFGNLNYAIFFALGFWLIMVFLLRKGLKELRKIETWGVLAIILIILGFFIYSFSKIKLTNLLYVNFSNLLLPFGVILFALLGFTSIPELRLEIKGQEKLFKKSIIIGILIPIILYFIFTLGFIGILGLNIPEIATLGSNVFMNLLGIFTMLTSFFVLSFSLKDVLQFDLKFSEKSSFLFVSLIPLLFYLIITLFNLLDFIGVIAIGGAVCGGITSILILIINKKAKKQGNRNPEYKMPLNWFWIIVLSLIFIFGILIVLFELVS